MVPLKRVEGFVEFKVDARVLTSVAERETASTPSSIRHGFQCFRAGAFEHPVDHVAELYLVVCSVAGATVFVIWGGGMACNLIVSPIDKSSCLSRCACRFSHGVSTWHLVYSIEGGAYR